MIMTSDVPGLVLSPHTFALFGFFFFYSKLCYPLSRFILVHQVYHCSSECQSETAFCLQDVDLTNPSP